jgi:hypothetical protein
MYAHGQVYDAEAGEMVDVGNNVMEALARDPKRYFRSRDAYEASLPKPKPGAPARDDNAPGAS